MKLTNDVYCFGCSWTNCYGLDPDKSWPQYLQLKLKDTQVHNLGINGADIKQTIHSIFRCIDTSVPKTIILQLTSLDRFHYGVGGRSNFLSGGLNTTPLWNYANGLMITDLYSYLESSKTSTTAFDNITSFLELDKAEYKNFIKFHYENISFDLYNQENTLLLISLTVNYLEQLGVNVVMFPYADEGWIETDGKSGILSSSIFTKYLKDSFFLRNPFKNWMLDHYGSEHFIDNGYHLSEKGCKILVDEYLMPNCIL